MHLPQANNQGPLKHQKSCSKSCSKREREREREERLFQHSGVLRVKMGRVLALCCLLALTVLASNTQGQDSSCLNQLVPCLDYVSSNQTPPSSCCDPLKSFIKSDPKCLCNMLGNKSMTQQAGINVTQAQGLPSRCGVKNVSPASCSRLPSQKAGSPNSASKLSLAKTLLVAAVLVIIQISFA